MVLHCLDTKPGFPPIEEALKEPDGLLCFGSDLSAQRLNSAYQQGIFPWYSENDPILWWSPSMRMVLPTQSIHIGRSLKKALKKDKPIFYLNRNFEQVITACANIKRNEAGRWIHDEMISTYIDLFRQGHAFSIEVEVNKQITGGLYGVKTEHIYCGESMFSLQPNGSKYALVGLCAHLAEVGIKWLDCQIYSSHLDYMGAFEITRQKFKQILEHQTELK